MPSPPADPSPKRPPASLALAGGMLAVVALVAVALAFSGVARLGKSNVAGQKKRPGRTQTISGPPSTPFELRYPAGWRKISKGDLQRTVEDTPTAAIRRADGRGLVTLTIRGGLATPLDQMREDFTRALASRFDDFELVTSRELEVKAGIAMYTSWILRDQNRIQGNLTVPVGDRSYTLDAALPAGATDVAREVGAIFGSFDVKPAG